MMLVLGWGSGFALRCRDEVSLCFQGKGKDGSGEGAALGVAGDDGCCVVG